MGTHERPGQPLVAGYQAGADKLKEFVEWCDELAIPVVTLWVLSTDNFQRSGADEIGPLLKVIEQMVTDLSAAQRWRIHPVGALDLLPPDTAEVLKAADAGTSEIDGMQVNIAVSYGAGTSCRTRSGRCWPSTPATAPRSRTWPRPSTSGTSPSTSTPAASPIRT